MEWGPESPLLEALVGKRYAFLLRVFLVLPVLRSHHSFSRNRKGELSSAAPVLLSGNLGLTKGEELVLGALW